MSKELSDALGDALALLDRASPGPWVVSNDNDGDPKEYGPLWCVQNAEFDTDDVESDDHRAFQAAINYGCKDDAEAIRAAVNLLRQHGEAIEAVLRAVEGAWTSTVFEAGVNFGDEVFDIRPIANAHRTLIGKRVALVPLDAAGSAEGRGRADPT